MAKFKKMTTTILCILMAFSIISVNAQPVTETSIDIESDYIMYDEYFEVSIKTADPIAAIDGTFTYDSDLVEFLPNETVFYYSENTLSNSLNVIGDGSVKLVLLGNVEVGTTDWVSFRFKALKAGDATFNLTDTLVSNIDEEAVSVTINSLTIEISIEEPVVPSYTVSVPSGVKNITGAGSTLLGSISLVENSILPENGLVITAAASNDSKLINVDNASKTIPYSLTSDTEQTAFTNVIFTSSGANSAKNVYVYVAENDWKASKAGNYTGVITFNIEELS